MKSDVTRLHWKLNVYIVDRLLILRQSFNILRYASYLSFYFCIEYQQGPGGWRGCHCEAMKFQFHSKMHLILSDSIANLLRIVSQVSDLYLTGYNSQFISIKIDLKHRTSQLFHCPCPFHVCQRRFATAQNASAASKIDLLSARISPKPSQRTNFHWAIKRADMSLTIYQNYANIREEAFFMPKNKLGSLTGC